jgi:K+-transporting ATPase ATPase C chain
MRAFFASFKPALISLTLLTLLLGIVYPLFMFCVGQVFFHRKANGTLFYYKSGDVIGSQWIAQGFTKSEYFHPRPSSAGDSGYDAANSSGSNLGPTSQKLSDALSQRAGSYRSENSIDSGTPIPADAVTTSGSGLDPHISVANARLQAARVASARSMSVEEVGNLIAKYTEGSTLGLFGEPRVNVLRLNLALDKMEVSE